MTRALLPALLAAAAMALPATAQPHKPRQAAENRPTRAAERAPVQDFAAGEPGNPREPAILITITMQETYDGKMLFAPNEVSVPTGQQVRFVLTNYGELDHAFVIGTEGEAKERQVQAKPAEPNARLVPAASQADLLWKFSKPGRYEFASVLPGQYAAGMRGTISVGQPTQEE